VSAPTTDPWGDLQRALDDLRRALLDACSPILDPLVRGLAWALERVRRGR
jgi:hypothetical protein